MYSTTAPREGYRPSYKTIGAIELKAVHRFTCLECTITADAKIDQEVDSRLAKVNSTFGRLKRVQYNKHPKKDTKINVNGAIILATFLYGSLIGTTYNSSNGYTGVVSTLSFTQLILKSSKMRISPVSRPCY